MEAADFIPKWQKELLSFKGIKSTFIIEGNIFDEYPCFLENRENGNTIEFVSLDRVIHHIFNTEETQGAYHFQFYDPLFGFSDPLYQNQAANLVRVFEKKAQDKQKEIRSINGDNKTENHSGVKMVLDAEIIRSSMTTRGEGSGEELKPIVNVINLASRFLVSPDNMNTDEKTFFVNLLYASNNAIRINRFVNTLILAVNKLNDIPAWFFLNNPNVRTVTIPNPDRNARSAYITRNYAAFSEEGPSESGASEQASGDSGVGAGGNASRGIGSPEVARLRNRLIDLTEGMKILELGELRRLYDKSNTPVEEIADVVAIYKYGFKENKWAQINGKLGDNMRDSIKARVKGQDQAVDKIVRVIKRAIVGLSGLQHSSGTKPRGILFLAGPTGTGKTEIVKAVTELLFEDEKALIRFDMSEYAAENADQKLFGAPPGYVGYDNGGQLTNAVKNSPFSVLLFDEIEKAHPSIMDKFLQIMEDGRMTDGQGNTVYFTETLIFFTSNVGISQETLDAAGRVTGRVNIVVPGEAYDAIQAKVENAMRNWFKPEVINRIGENIVVFNYIEESASREIADAQIGRIGENLLKNNKITIEVREAARALLYGICWDEKVRENGGRGIGNVIEEQYLNPLAEFIFDNGCGEGDIIVADAEGGAGAGAGMGGGADAARLVFRRGTAG